MRPHEERVQEEHTQLSERLSKLRRFMAGEVFGGLPRDEQVLLDVQLGVMRLYREILEERMKHFRS